MAERPCKVFATKRAQKDVNRAPRDIRERFYSWVDAVEKFGLRETRKSPGLHDEKLHGDRAHQRSVRLGVKWRAI